jgi:hypothetical protein
VSLLHHLKTQSLVTGPLKLSVNNSTLSVIKDWLLGIKPKSFDPYFRKFGREFHSHSLEFKKIKGLTKPEALKVVNMGKNLSRHPIFAALMVKSKKEILCKGFVATVRVHGTLDIWKACTKQAGDPKTTSTINEQSFIASCYKYGYLRQGILYCLITGAKEFYFFGVQKKYPYRVYVLDLHAVKHNIEYDYYYNELMFLLYVYKNYGLPIIGGKKAAINQKARSGGKTTARRNKTSITKRGQGGKKVV